MYLHNAWYIAGWSSEFTATTDGAHVPGRTGRALPRGERIAGRAGGPLLPPRECRSRIGEVVGNDIRCEYHGMVFDGTGRCVEIPNQNIIPATAKDPQLSHRGAGRSGLDLDGRS